MYNNDPKNVLTAVKNALQSATTHNLAIETECPDPNSFIVSDDGDKYRISVTLINDTVGTLNKDVQTREQILYGEDYDKDHYPGGYRSFDGITPDTLQRLVDMKFADSADKHNYAPTIAEFLEYAQTHKNVTVSGYAIDIARDDYRISVDEIHQDFETEQDIIDFTNMFRSADEFSIDEGHGYAWFD